MKINSLLGLGRFMIPVPAIIGQRTLLGKARKERARLGSIRSEEHHLVHDFVTREIPRAGEPISPEFIGQQLKMPVDRVNAILDELEKKLILYREGQEAVVWSYPVTAAKTPHHLTFSTGEQGYAAWAIDAVATPFVQGRLRTKNSEPLSIVVKTECAHCGQPLHIEIDSEMRCRVEEEDADPWVFIADVDFSKLTEPSIVDVFWRESVFFWSEEHAREHRRQVGGVRGIYMTLERTAYVNSIMQDAIFAFSERGWGSRRRKRKDSAESNGLDTDHCTEHLSVTNPLREPVLRSAIQALQLPMRSRGLDAGCGIGLQTVLLAEAVGPAEHITGLDLSPEFLLDAEEIVRKSGLSKQISLGYCHHLFPLRP